MDKKKLDLDKFVLEMIGGVLMIKYNDEIHPQYVLGVHSDGTMWRSSNCIVPGLQTDNAGRITIKEAL